MLGLWGFNLVVGQSDNITVVDEHNVLVWESAFRLHMHLECLQCAHPIECNLTLHAFKSVCNDPRECIQTMHACKVFAIWRWSACIQNVSLSLSKRGSLESSLLLTICRLLRNIFGTVLEYLMYISLTLLNYLCLILLMLILWCEMWVDIV